MLDSLTLEDRVEPEFPEARGSFFERAGVLPSRTTQAGRGDARMVQFTGVAHIPALQAGGGNFGVELQPQREVTYCKRLILIYFRFCKMKRA